MKENSITKFVYEDNPISFLNDDTIMLNATEMAKTFGKSPRRWLELPSTKEFLETLTDVRKSDIGELIITRKGGDNKNSNNVNQGTWMNRDVALEFARWLDPRFAIWCNDRIIELMQIYNGTLVPVTSQEPETENTVIKYITGYGNITVGKEERINELEDYNYMLIRELEIIKTLYNDKIKSTSFSDFVHMLNNICSIKKNWTEEDIKKRFPTVFLENPISGKLEPAPEVLIERNYSFDSDGTLLISFREQIYILKSMLECEYRNRKKYSLKENK